MPPDKIEEFWKSLDNSASLAVIYYVELLKMTIEMVKFNYPKNIYRIKKTINTLFAMANELK